MFPDLQSFLRFLETQGDLQRVTAEVDPELEITEIATRVVRQEGPALLFERVGGSAFPLAINLFGAERRITWALGRSPEAIGEELAGLATRLTAPSWKSLWTVRHSFRRAMSMRTRRVRDGLCQEQPRAGDLSRLPILQCWPGDGGRFLTFGLVITHDPQTRQRNLGLYRMHLYGPNRTGMHWQLQKGGGFHYWQAEQVNQPLEVAVVIGGDPILLLASVLPLPEGMDEIAFSGFLRGAPTPMVKGVSIGIDVPANAEFILEGMVPPQERAMEGPFGDHFGHYSAAAPFPVFHLHTMTHRHRPVYLAAVVGKPPQEDKYIGNASQEILGPLIHVMHPEIRDLWAYYEAGFHNLLVVSVRQRYGKEAMKTALALLGEGQMSLTKCIIVVDVDVDPRDIRQVLRSVRQCFQPERDFLLIPGVALDTLDFTSSTMHLGSKMVLDATEGARPANGHCASFTLPDLRMLDPRILNWQFQEDTLLLVQVKAEGRAVIEHLVKHPALIHVKLIAAVSPDIDLQDPESWLWGLFTRFDCARDVVFSETTLVGSVPRYRGGLGVDATWKPGYPDPLVMTPEVTERVNRRWHEYGF